MEQSNHNDADRPERWAIFLLIVTFLAVVQAVYSFRAVLLHGGSGMMAFVTEAACTLAMGVIAYGIQVALKSARRRPFVQQLLLACALATVGSACFVEAVGPLMEWLPPYEAREIAPRKLLLAWLLWLPAFFCWAMLVVAHSYAYTARERGQRLAAAQLLAHKAQVRALRHQINPHFLFNSLNAISSMVHGRELDCAERTIINLSTYLRTTLERDPHTDVMLAEEIAAQQLYLEIEQIRFPDRLSVEIAVPAELGTARVPSFILRPLVENAITRTVEPSKTKTRLRISAYRDDDRLVLEVEDDGKASAVADGVGAELDHVRQRILARFGDNGSFDAVRHPGAGFCVSLRMPLQVH